jgi:putative tryptophan/tyrosine transport system substrate-binding protein
LLLANCPLSPIPPVANPCCNRVLFGVVLALRKAMRRRDFIKSIAGSVALWPLAARAQQTALPVIGFLTGLGRNDRPSLREGFRRGLGEGGFIEGRNLAIEYRFAENQYDQLPTLAADLVGRKVAAIAATGSGNAILAAKASTSTIPIVFTTGGDPVREGYVASLNRPGGNITGIAWFSALLGAKQLGLLHELVPKAAVIALLVNPRNGESAREPGDVQRAASALGRQVLVLNASAPSDIDVAFATMQQRHADGLLVTGDPFLSSRRQQIVALATRDAIPAIYGNSDFIAEGGLMSYGNDIPDAYRRAGIYITQIMKGASPADLPIDQATKFEFVINLKTAKALGLTVPDKLLGLANEVTE